MDLVIQKLKTIQSISLATMLTDIAHRLLALLLQELSTALDLSQLAPTMPCLSETIVTETPSVRAISAVGTNAFAMMMMTAFQVKSAIK
jgi:hypothetical protein